MAVPNPLKIYHIVHVDRMASILNDGHLWCDAKIVREARPGTTIGMGSIKSRRLTLPVNCRPGLHVGDCVPFYFCPRSIMLYLLYRGNHEELSYRGGQEPIVHLVSDFHQAVSWAEDHNHRWAFTLSNAGARYFEDRCAVLALDEISWPAVGSNQWAGDKEGKQAEFLLEECFPWHLIERIGVYSLPVAQNVSFALQAVQHRPPVEIQRGWYY